MVDVRFSSSLQILIALAILPEKRDDVVNSQVLASSLGTNPTFIRKLLVPLSQAGLVETVKGQGGGSRLAKTPKKITLRQIYEASVDSPLIEHRKTASDTCRVAICMDSIYANVTDGIEQAFLSHLQSKSLYQVINLAGL